MFSHILVPLDGSSHSLKAAEAAVDLAQKYNAKLTLLHVAGKFQVPDQLKEYLRGEHLSGNTFLAIDEATQKFITDVHRKAKSKGLTEARKVFLEGRPARTIIDYAKKENVDAIVMGSRGLSDIGGILLGSVSHKVASLAECSVIMIK